MSAIQKFSKILLRVLAFFLCIVLTFSTMSFSGSCIPYQSPSNYNSGVFYHRLCSTELTGNPRVDIINIALSQYGYSESDDWWDMSGMDMGINNYTEYGYWYDLQGMWCAMFVSWCANFAEISDQVIPPHSYTASGVLWFMDRGRSYTRKDVENGKKTPKSGDLIYFRSDRNNSIVNHVGIVVGYFDGYVYTIEGNVNQDPNCTDGGQVLLRSRHISDTFIRYFCTPAYSSDSTHDISNFYPETYQVPDVADAEITLGEYVEDAIDIPDSGNQSNQTQFTFIP